MNKHKTILSIDNLSVGYIASKQEKVVLSELNLNLGKGSLTCLLGPNGSGKSTLIRTLNKIQKPLNGTVALDGRDLTSYSAKELARKVSLVLTDRTAPGNLTAFALVSLGRFPYTSWMGTLSQKDEKLIAEAMEQTGTLPFANRHIGELSDGERQKVMIARALVQDTEVIFLDEPTAHLDLPNRIEIFHLLRALAHESDRAILLSTHEMDMAITNADRLWLVSDSSIVSGLPEDIVLSGQLANAFVKEGLTFDYTKGSFQKQHHGQRRKIALEGPEVLVYWTRNALERRGFEISAEATQKITVSGTREFPEWRLTGSTDTFKNIETLLINIDNT